MSRLESINNEQRLYVLKSGYGFSCYGFDNAENAAREAAAVLKRPELVPTADKGTAEHYRQYEAATAALCAARLNKTSFHHGTPQEVRDVIELARVNHTRVRIFNGDTETGKAWAEEYEVIGTISRSMGPIKIPLMIHSARSSGGGLLDHCIVAIKDTSTGRFLYKHPSFDVGVWTIGPPTHDGYHATVLHDGNGHAQFKKPGQAERYIAYMKGERFSK